MIQKHSRKSKRKKDRTKGGFVRKPLILLAFLALAFPVVLPINTQNGAFSYSRVLMKCGIYHTDKFFGLIILYLCINVHSCFAVFMSCQILNRLGIDPCIKKIRDICVTQLVRRNRKVHTLKPGIQFVAHCGSLLYKKKPGDLRSENLSAM